MACEPYVGQRPARAVAMGQLVPVNCELDTLWTKANSQPVPTRLARETLYGQGRTLRRLDCQAQVVPPEHRADRLGSREAAEREVDEPALVGRLRTVVVIGNLQPARSEWFVQPTVQGRAARRNPQAVCAGQLRFIHELWFARLYPACRVDLLEPLAEDLDLTRPLK